MIFPLTSKLEVVISGYDYNSGFRVPELDLTAGLNAIYRAEPNVHQHPIRPAPFVSLKGRGAGIREFCRLNNIGWAATKVRIIRRTARLS